MCSLRVRIPPTSSSYNTSGAFIAIPAMSMCTGPRSEFYQCMSEGRESRGGIDSGRAEREDEDELEDQAEKQEGRIHRKDQKRKERSEERGGVKDKPAACCVQHESYTIHGKYLHRPHRTHRGEDSGTSKCTLQPLKCTRIARGKVGGHAHKEGECHASTCRFLLPWCWDLATHIRKGERWEGGGEEGEEGANSMILTSIPNNQTIATPAPPVLTFARCAKEFGGGFRQRYCGGKKRDVVPLHARSPHAADVPIPAHALRRLRSKVPKSSDAQSRKSIGRWAGNAVEDGREKREYMYAPQKPTTWRDAEVVDSRGCV
ncbi:hypothetical protein B0H13DRAFT_1883084 [Mycena leptocephala]|nr:hypothetical protein B0H13DRAFT_1883084 [Mycena leptocephala]